MSDVIQSAVLLFIIAFLLGLAIGYFLRRNAYKKKYSAQITALEDENSQSEYFYTQALEKSKHLEKQLIGKEEVFHTQQNVLQELEEKENKTKQYHDRLIQDKNNLDITISNIDQEYQKYIDIEKSLLADLDIIHQEEPIIQEQTKKINLLEDEHHNIKTSYNEHQAKITSLQEDQIKLKNDNILLSDTYEAKQKTLTQIQENIQKIGQQFQEELETCHQTYDNLRIKALNYEYEYKDKQNGVAIPKNIEKFVKKNDETRFVDKLMHKVFRKKFIPNQEI